LHDEALVPGARDAHRNSLATITHRTFDRRSQTGVDLAHAGLFKYNPDVLIIDTAASHDNHAILCTLDQVIQRSDSTDGGFSSPRSQYPVSAGFHDVFQRLTEVSRDIECPMERSL
jgi:hypothetical protein